MPESQVDDMGQLLSSTLLNSPQPEVFAVPPTPCLFLKVCVSVCYTRLGEERCIMFVLC